MAEEVYINVPAVRNIAKTFGDISETLKTVNKILEAISNTLKIAAMIGLIGAAAVAQFIDQIRPRIEEMSEKCEELNGDIVASVDAYERGDQQGATRFH